MKQKLIHCCAGALICVLCAGCNELKQMEEGAEVNPIPVSEVDDEVSAFFENNVPLIGSSIFYEYDSEKGEIVDSCLLINSMEELPKANYDGTPFDFEYPAIDFDAYTLVIGQFAMDYHGNNYIASKRLVIKQNVAIMNLNAVHELKKGAAYTTDVFFIPVYFWALYPKTDAKSIHLNISYETKYI